MMNSNLLFEAHSEPTSLNSLYSTLIKENRLAADFRNLGNPIELLPIPNSVDLADRAVGTLLGVAIGDALGRSHESMLPGTYHIEKFEPWHGYESGPVGTITDDTQFTMWLAQSLVENRTLVPDDLIARWSRERIRGIGKNTREFLHNAKNLGLPWYQTGPVSSGNGVAMRSTPVGLFYRNDPEGLKLASIIQSVITHNDPMAIASGIIVAAVVAMLLRMNPNELEPVSARIAFSKKLAGNIKGIESCVEYRTRKDAELCSLYQRLDHDLPHWLETNAEPISINDSYWSGAYVLESLPHALYCFLAAPTDFRKVLISSANTSRDSDTVASIACAFAGALNGARSISADFKDELEYRPILESLALKLIK